MKSKLMIFLLLISVAGFSQIRHDQLRKPVVESTDTVLMFKNTSMGFEYTRTVLDTTIIKGLDLFVKERVSDSINYLIGILNDTVTYILGQIPTTLVELDSSGFSITEGQISDLKNYLTVEVDPIYSLDSAKIVWFKDLKFTQDSLKTAADSIQAHNLRLLEKQNLSDTLTYDATKYDLEQLKLADLDSTGFSVDTTQVRDLLEFVQNNGGSGSGDGYWEETLGGDTIQNKNSAPVKIQTSLLFGDEEVVTGSTGMFVYGGSYNTATATTYPIMKSVDYGATYNGLTQSERYFSNISVNSTGQYISYYNNFNGFLSSDFGTTWTIKPISYGTPVSMSDSGQKMVYSFFLGNTYSISTNYGATFSSVTANGVTGNLSSAHITGDGTGIYLNGSEISRKVYYSSDGVNFTSFGGDLVTGSSGAALASGGSVFVIFDGSLIKKSTNRGSWVDITPSGLLNATGELDVTPDGTIIGLSNFNNTSALVTRDGGSNWYSLPSGSAVKFRTISLSSDGNDVYLGGNDGRIYKFEWIGSGYLLSTSTLVGNGQVHVETNKGTSSISVHPFEVRENSNYLEASVNNQTAFKINQDGQFGLRTGGFASKINTTVTGDFSALITDKAVKDYIDGSGSTMVYPAAGIPVSLGTSWRSTSIPPAVGYLYYNGANYTWNSGSSDGNNYPTTLVYTAADRQLTLGRNGLSSISTFFPLASATDAGLIKVGSGLSIDGNGVLSSSGGSMVYPSGSGIPTINSGAWGTTIPPSNGYLNYNNGTWSFSTPSGGGDMFKATYDTNSNNVVDNAEALGGVVASSYATLTGSQSLTNKSVNGVTLSSTGNGLSYLSNDGTYKTVTSGGMVYPSSGLAKSTGSAWAASIPDNSTNWNTAYNDRITSLAFSGTTTKTLTLTQSDGGTVVGSFTDLGGATNLTTSYNVDGYSITINSDTGTDATINSASSNFAGLMSFVDKGKVDKIVTNGNGLSYLANDGTYKSVSTNTNLTTSYSSTTATINSDTGTDAVINSATSVNSGVMSSSDKIKLDKFRDPTPQSITTSISLSSYINFYTTASSDKTIAFSNVYNGASGQIVIEYLASSKITFSASGYTIKIAANISNPLFSSSVLTRSSGFSVYSYYISGTNIFINGTQYYN